MNDPKQYLLWILFVLEWVLVFSNPKNQVEVLIESQVFNLMCLGSEFL